MFCFKKWFFVFLAIVTALADVPLTCAATVNVSNQVGQNLLYYSEQFDNAAWFKRGTATVTADQTMAPDGTMTADLISGLNALVTGDIYNTALGDTLGPPNYRYEVSVWIKRVSTSGTLYVVSAQNGRGYAVDLSLVGDGWVRVKLGAPGVSTYIGPGVLQASGAGGMDLYAGAGAPLSFYAWGAQGVLGTKAGAYNKTTASRISSSYLPTGATMSSQLGQNLVTNSEQFNSWTIGAGASVTANAAMAPDGTMTAERITYAAANGYVNSAAASIQNRQLGAKYTFSLWLWSATKTSIGLRTYSSPGDNLLEDHRTILLTPTPTRYTFTVPVIAAGSDAAVVLDLENRVPYGSDGGEGSLYAWGAQIVPGSKPGAYNRTTSVAKNGMYAPTANAQSSQRGQNLLTYSEQLDNAAWSSPTTGVTVTANAVYDPWGGLTADQLDFAATTAYRYQSYTINPLGKTLTWSVWLYSPTKATIAFRLIDNLASQPGVTTKTINLTPGWKRYSLTVPFSVSASSIIVGFENRTILGGDGIAGTVYVSGAQLVYGFVPGAYNKTTATSFNPNYQP